MMRRPVVMAVWPVRHVRMLMMIGRATTYDVTPSPAIFSNPAESVVHVVTVSS